MVVVTADAVDQCVCGVDGGHGWDTEGDCFTTEDYRVTLWVAAFFGGGDDVINLATFNKVTCVEFVAFVNLVEFYNVNVRVCGFDGFCSPFGCINFKALVVEFLCNVSDFVFILVTNGDEDATVIFEGVAGCDKALVECFKNGFANAEYFTGRFHFRPELGVNVCKLFKGEDWYLNSNVFARWVEASAISEVCELFAKAYASCKVNHWYSSYFTDVRNGTRCTRVYFDDIEIFIVHDVLDVGKPNSA